MRLRVLLTIGLLAALGGCGGGPDFVPVTGRVMLDGKPLAHALVAFNPSAPEGKIVAPGPGSMGITDEQGRYVLKVVGTDGRTDGAVVGEHRVRISTSGVATRPGEDAPTQRERVPEKYNAHPTLRFTVKPGENVANFDLEGR